MSDLMPPPDREAVKTALAGRWVDFYDQFTILRRKGHSWRGACPLHRGDGLNFAVNEETGEWYCHSHCQAGGDAFAFLMRLEGLDFLQALRRVAEFAGTAPPPAVSRPKSQKSASLPFPPIAIDYHRRLMSDTPDAMQMRTYLCDRRGLCADTLARFKIGLCRDAAGQERVTFPVYDEAGTLVNVRKHLFAHDPALTEARRRELGKTLPHAPGLPSPLYPLAALGEATDVVVVEGESDALLACQMGLPAVTGTLGAGNWLPEWTATLQGRRVTLLYDGDAAGQKGAQTAARSLTTAGSPARIAVYPPGVKDLTEWVVEQGATFADVQAVLQAAVPAPEGNPPGLRGMPASPPRKSIAARTISARQVGPPPTELPYLFGPYLNIGATHWLTGQTGIGKSTFLYNVLPALAEGTELWGVPCKQARVLYLDMESGDLGRSLKMQRLFPSAAGRQPPEDWLFATEPIRLPDELDDFLTFVKAERISLVVFDTARRCFTVRDENDNAEVYVRVIPTLDSLKAAGVASLVLGHPSKNGLSGARGAGAQEDAGDVNLTLTMHQGQVTDSDGILILRVTKNRLLGLDTPPLFLRRVGADRFDRVEAGDAYAAAETAECSPGKQEQCEADILDFLLRQPETHAGYKEIMEAMRVRGHAESTAKRAHRELDSKGLILRAPHDCFPKGGWILPPGVQGSGSSDV